MQGQVLGKYRITGVLGEGGMGTVFIADHTTMGFQVAVKLLLPELSTRPDIVARFFNEAQAVSLIKHPALVQVYDSGYSENGSAYIAMEHLRGETLSAKLAREGRLPAAAAVGIGQQVASALATVHAKKIIHRDLKPENLFVVTDPRSPIGVSVKILDFGIAKLSAESQEHSVRTRTGTVMGTAAYMSPEQCRGSASLDARADIYSLGCILYQMVTGRPPFDGEGFGEIIAKHIYMQPQRPMLLNPGLPPQLDAVILRALAKRPEDRWQSMDELLVELDSMAAQPYAGQPPTTLMPALSLDPAQPRPGPRSRKWLIGLGFLAAAAGTGGIAMSRGGAPAVSTAPPPPVPVVVAPAPIPVAVPEPPPAPVVAPVEEPPAAAPAPPPETRLAKPSAAKRHPKRIKDKVLNPFR